MQRGHTIDVSSKGDNPNSVHPEPVEGQEGFDRLSPNGVLNYGTLNNSRQAGCASGTNAARAASRTATSELTTHRREVIQKNFERIARFKVVEKRLDGDSRTREHRSSAVNFRINGDWPGLHG